MANQRIFLCFLIVCGAAAQEVPEVTTQQGPATFSSRVNLVSVPVVVRDREGRAIGGLKREDFQLFDKNRPQIITKFSIEASSLSATAAAGAPAIPSAPPGRYVAYFFDDVNLKADELLEARQAASRHLNKALDAGTRASVSTLSGRVRQDFTTDAEKLREAMNRIQPHTRNNSDREDCPYVSYYVANLIDQGQAGQLSGAVYHEAGKCLGTDDPQILEPVVKMAVQKALANGQTDVLGSLVAFANLVRGMSLLPGSRSIVVVSPGFILPDEQRVILNDLFDKAIRARITINTLDVRGLYTPPGAGDASRGGLISRTLNTYDDQEAKLDGNLLAEFANATGGTFFHNDNGLGEGLDQLAARPEHIYVLSFSPDDIKYDGSYHALKVKLRGSPSMTIQSRLGYWAPKHATDPAEEAREDIKDAVFSSEQIRAFPVGVHTEYFKQSNYRAQLTVETRVDASGLKFRKVDDRNRDSLTVITGLFDENGRYLKGTERTLNMRLRDQTLESARNSGLNVTESFDVAPGRYSVRVVVRDFEGRSITAQSAGVEIP